MRNRVMKIWSSTWRDVCGIARTYPFACFATATGMLLVSLMARYVDGQSLTAWSVEIWDIVTEGAFHDYSANVRMAPHGAMSATNILILLPWAVWNFPIWLTHPLSGNAYVLSAPCLLWSKMFLVVCAFFSGLLCGKIVEHVSETKEHGWTAAVLFWGAGTLAISVGWCMQDEIVYILAMLAAVYYTLIGKRWYAVCWMSYAILLNPTMGALALLLVLYSFKGLISRFLVELLICAPCMLNQLLFAAGFKNPTASSIDECLEWVFGRSWFGGGNSSISVVAAVMCILIALQFFNQYKNNDDRQRYLLYFITCMMIVMRFFSWSHVYRFFLCMPFLIISILTTPDLSRRVAGMAGLCVFEYCGFLHACFENYWFKTDAMSNTVRLLFNIPSSQNTSFYALFLKFFPTLEGKEYIVWSVICACGLWLLWLAYPNQKQILICKFSPRIIVSIYSLCTILFTSIFCLMLLKTEFTAVAIEEGEMLAPALTGANSLDEYYKAEDSASKASITIRPVTWDKAYPQGEGLQIEVIDMETGERVGKTEISAASLPNNQLYTLELEDISVKSGRWYIFRLSATGLIENEDNYLYILRSEPGTADPEKHYAVIRESSGGEIRTDNDWISQIVLY